MKQWLMVLMCLCCVLGFVTLSACGGASGPEEDEAAEPPPGMEDGAPTPGEGEEEGGEKPEGEEGGEPAP